MNIPRPTFARVAALAIMTALAVAGIALAAVLVAVVAPVDYSTSLSTIFPLTILAVVIWWMYRRGWLQQSIGAIKQSKPRSKDMRAKGQLTPDPVSDNLHCQLREQLAKIYPPPDDYAFLQPRYVLLRAWVDTFWPVGPMMMVLLGLVIFYPETPWYVLPLVVVAGMGLIFALMREKKKFQIRPITCEAIEGILEIHEDGVNAPYFIPNSEPDPYDVRGIALASDYQTFWEQYVPGLTDSTPLQVPDEASEGGVRIVRVRQINHLIKIKKWHAKIDMLMRAEELRLASEGNALLKRLGSLSSEQLELLRGKGSGIESEEGPEDTDNTQDLPPVR